MKSIKIKTITILSSLTAVGVVLSIIDKFISSVAFPFLPMVKIGLANIVVLIGIYKYDVKTSLILPVLKSILTGLLVGGAMSFVIGFSGTMLSFILMQIFKNILKEKVSIIGVSVIGGVSHIIGQCIVIALIYNLGSEVMLYLGALIIVSIITSLLIGLLSKKLLSYKNSQF